jgi:hypothetical protein
MTIASSNIPRARIDGYTLSYNGSFGPLLNASLDAMDPRNELTGKRLARRSANLHAGADYLVGALCVPCCMPATVLTTSQHARTAGQHDCGLSKDYGQQGVESPDR